MITADDRIEEYCTCGEQRMDHDLHANECIVNGCVCEKFTPRDGSFERGRAAGFAEAIEMAAKVADERRRRHLFENPGRAVEGAAMAYAIETDILAIADSKSTR